MLHFIPLFLFPLNNMFYLIHHIHFMSSRNRNWISNKSKPLHHSNVVTRPIPMFELGIHKMHSLYLLGFLLQFSLKRWKEIDYKLKTHEWKLKRTFLFIQKCNQILGPFIFKRDRFCIDILDVSNSWKMQFKPLRMEASIPINNLASVF